MKKWFQNLNAKNTEMVDEHSQPTEPLPPLDPLASLILPATPLYPVSPSGVDVIANTPTLPIGQPAIPVAVPPGPYDATSATPSGAQWQPYQAFSPSPSYAAPAQVYPYLPVAPQQMPQPQEPTWLQPKVGQQLTPVVSSISGISRTIPVPLLVGLGFVAIQLILVARLVVLFVPNGTVYTWSATIIALGDLCAEPFFVLIQQATLPNPVNTAVATLLAIFAYGIISRMLVRLLKLLLRRGTQTV